MTNATFSIHTLGCKVNAYESNIIIEACEKKGFQQVPFGEKSDICIVNTCAVTEESAKKSKKYLRRAKKSNPDCILVMAGCLVQAEKEAFSAADIVIGNKNKAKIADYIEEYMRNQHTVTDIPDIGGELFFETMRAEHYENTRATVKIQDGCNNFCSYCIIPYTRGRIRSKPMELALTEMAALAGNGYQEIVLTGIHLDSYGKETGNFGLCDLLEQTNQITNLKRLRLGSLEPVFITDETIERLRNVRALCPQFHLSLQSGCDETLRRMNRHYTAAQYTKAVERIKKAFPDAAITTDIIVGFCGETRQEFEQSLAFAEKTGFSKIHVFPFSERAGTKAYHMEGKISPETKAERVKQMLLVAASAQKAFRQSQKGKAFPVLIEKIEDGICEGYTPNYLKTQFPDEGFQINQIVTVPFPG